MSKTTEAQWDSLYRGRVVRVVTGSIHAVHDEVTCGGPFYWREDGKYVVCPHIAEIGD